ncbi:MAG: polysaccharide pyruvyl transferase family protein [Bacteroidales bacterium]|nr:polysaccharide pyruvyl transferase family protein [Bacteroidales bacterium]
MKVLITNTVALNGGDAAILHALIDVLRMTFGADTQFVVYDNQPDVAHKFYPGLKFRKQIYQSIISSLPSIKCKKYLQWLKLSLFNFAVWCWCNHLHFITKIIATKQELYDIDLYDSSDLIVSTGGTYLVENYSLIPRIFDYWISLLMKKPLAFYTQSLGPFRNKGHRIALKMIFDKAIVIFLRDKSSFEHIKELNIDMTKVYIFPDAAFALGKKEIPKSLVLKKSQKLHIQNVAISVRDWPFFNRINYTDGMNIYKATIRHAIEYLIKKHNANITFISTCQGIPEYWAVDSNIALDICSDLPDNIRKRIVINHDFHTPSELIGILTLYDIVIATRMHMAILSLIAGTPVFPIAYEFKTLELFNSLGLNDWIQNIETLEPHIFLEKLDSFLSRLSEIDKIVFPKIANIRKQAFDAGKKLEEEYYCWLNYKKIVM